MKSASTEHTSQGGGFETFSLIRQSSKSCMVNGDERRRCCRTNSFINLEEKLEEELGNENEKGFLRISVCSITIIIETLKKTQKIERKNTIL